MAGLHKPDVRQYVVRPALELLDPIIPYSLAAENLVLGTGIQETQLTYLHQIHGPALGIFQMEPATYLDLYKNYRPGSAETLELFALLTKGFNLPAGSIPRADLMVANLLYAAAMCQIFYRRVPKSLPKADDVEGLAQYWKTYYNTPKGKGTVDHARLAFHQAVLTP